MGESLKIIALAAVVAAYVVVKKFVHGVKSRV